jgi:hypothetical protein
MPRTGLLLVPTVSNSKGLVEIPIPYDNMSRGAGMRINSIQIRGQEAFQIMHFGPLFPSENDWETTIPFSSRDLFSYVQACRNEWQNAIVDYEEIVTDSEGIDTACHPFQENWDFENRSDLIREKGAKLAKAGNRLFRQIFESENNQILTVAHAKIRRAVAERLRTVATNRDISLVITITSNPFFAPWSMLYTHPNPKEQLAFDGSNFEWDGFWGLHHVIEHNTLHAEVVDTRIRPDKSGLICTSMNVDKNLDDNLGVTCIDTQIDFFNAFAHRIDYIERCTKYELLQALSDSSFKDKIVYFYCHGIGSGEYDLPNLGDARIVLTDGEDITGQDISDCLGDKDLGSNPIIFINACQSSHMTTIFYQALAPEFLKRQAVGLIGTQIDMPAVFACEYATRFFSKFLNGSQQNRVRVGPLMRDLAREFIVEHNNPLGLAYSLYRGADCFIDA